MPAIPALEAARSRNDSLNTGIGIIGQLMAATKFQEPGGGNGSELGFSTASLAIQLVLLYLEVRPKKV
ncbi:hypothetical protein MARLIPOL_10236 [Marinobacter lipolyticus SM19]|uniref:Uncharacterized protein n=1 Tax=Marinobacter lipolyticus SM19 TaxID=1318628 RepID=R8B066_9GAMM|nr:hypothetical protein MARLIPOL_10236 [Marinobacter lipolyticus SM19]